MQQESLKFLYKSKAEYILYKSKAEYILENRESVSLFELNFTKIFLDNQDKLINDDFILTLISQTYNRINGIEIEVLEEDVRWLNKK